MSTQATSQLFSKALLALYLISFLSGFSMGIFNPLISILMEQNEISQLVIGANSSIYYLCIALFAPFAGKIIRRYGFSFSIITGIVITTISTSLFPFTDNLLFWFILRSLMGIGICLYMVAGQTGLNLYASDERRGMIVATHGAAFGIGFVVSPMIGTILYASYPKAAFILGGSIILLGIFATLFINNKIVKNTYSFSFSFFRKISTPLYGVFIYGALEGILVTLLPIILLREALPIETLCIPLSLFMVASGIGMIPISHFGDKYGQSAVLYVAAIGAILTLILAVTVDYPYILGVCAVLLGLSLGTFFPITLTMIGKTASASEMPMGSALFTAAFSYGCTLGPLGAAIFISLLGDIHLFTLIIILLIPLIIKMTPSLFNFRRIPA